MPRDESGVSIKPNSLLSTHDTMGPVRLYDDTDQGCLGGFIAYDVLPKVDQERLKSIFQAYTDMHGSSCRQEEGKGTVFWVNLWQQADGQPPMELPGAQELHGFVQELVSTYYRDCKDGEDAQLPMLDGYGFTLNPPGSKAQFFHIDYNMGYSNLFVPLNALTVDNSTQYIVLPHGTPKELIDEALSDMRNVQLSPFTDTARGGLGYSARQRVAPPFSVLRMEPGTIHRGIACNGPETRILFYVSVQHGTERAAQEPALQREWYNA
eukprot:CAMPEP_0202890060 /NCGR_PEP_ID=MMETSP1392-20130828/578_1 /ASSEMBLY_ACC=CAM_ASM_000868 /TAXON_ID=225041 /ORGANISM="Chlamydomonas chlamydogama, Strain SAG 11-48b" /LENGTH=265 /DNA_ID=CAMNT_0049573545 /DNA_START=219 /DNA_END=1016 /DNA_ORIENTATION=+